MKTLGIAKEKFNVPNNSTVDVFSQDVSNMGTLVAKNVMILHHTHNFETARYIVVVDLTTGEKLPIYFTELKPYTGESNDCFAK